MTAAHRRGRHRRHIRCNSFGQRGQSVRRSDLRRPTNRILERSDRGSHVRADVDGCARLGQQLDNGHIHITGPLSVTLTPTNGASVSLGSSLVLTAALLGGTSPYTVTFYTNGQPVGTLGSAPFTTNLGVLPIGSYTSYVQWWTVRLPTAATSLLDHECDFDFTEPAARDTDCSRQWPARRCGAIIFANGKRFGSAPLTVSNVEFYYDGVLAETDSASPYSASITPALGSHTAYAVATDSIGRKTFTATNLFHSEPFLRRPRSWDRTATRMTFSAQPPAIEFATASVTGTAGDNYVMDNEVNAVITCCHRDGANGAGYRHSPAAALDTRCGIRRPAYLQTRPTGNRYTVLMGKVRQPKRNERDANSHLVPFHRSRRGLRWRTSGTRVYYSLTGTANSWTNIPPLNTMRRQRQHQHSARASRWIWTNGASLFLAWVDDNGQERRTGIMAATNTIIFR